MDSENGAALAAPFSCVRRRLHGVGPKNVYNYAVTMYNVYMENRK